MLVPAGASEVLHDSVARALAGERTTSFVDVRRRRDGALVEMDVALGPLHAADGSVVGVTRILHDRAGHETASVEGLAAQQHLFQALARRSWDAAIVVDEALRVRYAAPPVGGMLGYGADELVGTSAWSVLHPDDVAEVRPLVERVVAMTDHTERFLVRVRDRSGGWRWIEQTLTNCLADPEIGGIVVTLRDLTDQVETERLLRFSEALHRAIVETVQEGILATAPDGATMLANEKLAEILGLPLETLNSRDVHALLGRALRVEAALDPLESVRGPERYETTYAHPDGRERMLQVTRSLLHHPGGPETLGWLSLVSDVTEARRVEQELRRRALHDPLTGLPNRHLVLDRLGWPRAPERTPGATTAVLFLDLDGFKPINDSRGHEAGDELLIEVGPRLSRGGARQRHRRPDRRRRVRRHLRERRRGRRARGGRAGAGRAGRAGPAVVRRAAAGQREHRRRALAAVRRGGPAARRRRRDVRRQAARRRAHGAGAGPGGPGRVAGGG